MKQTKIRTAKVWRTTIATAGILLFNISAVQPAFAVTDPNPTPNSQASSHAAKVNGLAGHKTKNLCAAPTHPGEMACHSIVDLEVMTPMATTGVPSGYGPSDLRSAYSIPTDTSGVKKTVAIVSAYDAVNAESDLAVYRSKFGLPPCTTANGCFTKVDQNGGTSYPVADAGWAQESTLDLDMVSASCPTCNLVLVEANSSYLSDLGPSVNTAVQMGAIAVSNSYGGAERFDPSQYEAYFKHPGVAITASAGDSGYGVNYPAASQYVTAVGGTSLHASSVAARGWTEQAWGTSSGTAGTGSGCSTYNAKPVWQTDTGCSTRTVADISAVADTATGVAVYDSASGGWGVFGGTSVSSPLVAGMFATAGKPTSNSFPSSYAYAASSSTNDTTSGSNGACSPSNYFCTSGTGYDGPTGLGSPNGAAALTDLSSKFAAAESTANFGQPSTGIVCVADGSCSKTYAGGTIKWTYSTGTVATSNTVTPVPIVTSPPVTTAPVVPNPLDAIDTSGNLWAYSTSGNTSLGARTAIGPGWTNMKQLLSVDWNGDGKLDLVARGADGYLTLYPGVGDGTYKQATAIGFGGWQNYDITATKLRNSDAHPGLVARDMVGGNLYYYPNTTGGALTSPRLMIGNGGWSPMSEINALDWDKDGNMDLIVRNPSGELLLYRTDGAGNILNEARKSVDFGWNVMDSISAEPNFAGPGTVGFIARTTTGNLYYYPITNGKVGASTLIGNGGWSGYVIAAGTPVL